MSIGFEHLINSVMLTLENGLLTKYGFMKTEELKKSINFLPNTSFKTNK